MSGTAVHRRRRYRLCDGSASESIGRGQSQRGTWKTYGISSGTSIRIYSKDRGISAFELYSGRASTDHCDDFVISVSDTGGRGYQYPSSGQADRCSQTYCFDGSYVTGCHQRSGKYFGAETVIPGQSGLHDRWWYRFHRRSVEYSRPWYRETHYGKSRDRRAGTCRRDPKENVCIRRYSYA